MLHNLKLTTNALQSISRGFNWKYSVNCGVGKIVRSYATNVHKYQAGLLTRNFRNVSTKFRKYITMA